MRFRVSRAPQRTAPDVSQAIIVRPLIDAPPLSQGQETTPADANLAQFLSGIEALLTPGQAVARARVDAVEISPDELDTFIANNYALGRALLDLDFWLVSFANRPEAREFAAKLTSLGLVPLGAGWAQLRNAVATILEYEALAHGSPDILSRVTRLMMVIGLVELRVGSEHTLRSGDEIYRALRWRTPVLPPVVVDHLRKAAGFRRTRSRSLSGGQVRRPGFADLYVTREEWNRYEAGEIAFIENVLPGELKARQRESLTELEQTVTTDTSTVQIEESETQNTDRSEFHREAADASSLALGIDGKVEVSASYPSVSIAAQVGVSLDYSQEQSSEIAVTQSRETVSRALTRVEERVRQIRTSRTLTRTTETEKHEFKNEGRDPVVGIYRWVDKVQRVQVTRYPHRFLVEFEVPEPGAWIRWLRTSGQKPKLVTDEPPAFADEAGLPLSPLSITEESYRGYAAKFRAAGVVPPPEQTLVIGKNVSLDNTPGAQPTQNRFAGSETLALPEGYRAINWQATALGWADWINSGECEATVGELWMSVGASPDVGFRANLALHEHCELLPTLPGEPRKPIPVGNINTGVIPVAIQACKLFGYSVNVVVRCERTDTKYAEWQMQTFETIATAYYAWKRQYDEEKAADEDSGVPGLVDACSPARNQEIVREELKRQVVELLTGGDFRGRPAIENRDSAVGPNIDVSATVATAAEIQFLEQAFEWENLTYILYPYYWAGRDQWKDLEPVQGADEDFARFLRAGSARLVVPARPGFEEQVQMYTDMGVIWGGGPVPAPGEAGYLSVTDEIKAQQQRPSDGTDLAVWEVRLPTTLIWLQSNVALPVNPNPTIPAPAEKPD